MVICPHGDLTDIPLLLALKELCTAFKPNSGTGNWQPN